MSTRLQVRNIVDHNKDRKPSRWSAALLIRPPREDLCLSYANTLSWRGSDVPVDKFADFADLLSWLASSAGLPAHRFDEAAKWSSSHPEEAARLFVEAIAAREAIYCIFSALASGNGARDQDLDVLNRGLETAPMRTRLARADRGYAWRAQVAEVSAPALWPPFCGRPGTSWSRTCMNVFVIAQTRSACGFSSTTARMARGDGAT